MDPAPVVARGAPGTPRRRSSTRSAPIQPAARQAQTEDEELRLARERIASDSNVRQMAELFGAEVIPESIRKNPNPPPRK